VHDLSHPPIPTSSTRSAEIGHVAAAARRDANLKFWASSMTVVDACAMTSRRGNVRAVRGESGDRLVWRGKGELAAMPALPEQGDSLVAKTRRYGIRQVISRDLRGWAERLLTPPSITVSLDDFTQSSFLSDSKGISAVTGAVTVP